MAVTELSTAGAGQLSAYLPRLASEWQSTSPRKRWRAIDGTLVFADISGFTALSERLAKLGPIGAEELTDVLGRCFADLLAVAYGYGGSLLKFGGDALLLLFDGSGHPERAVRSAMAMRAALRDVGKLTTSVGKVRLRMSVGVHSGQLHVFRVGSSHKELIVAGPGASTTVAMEGVADAGEIVVSEDTAALIDPGLLGAGKGTGVLLRNRATPFAPPERDFPHRSGGAADALESIPVALRSHLCADVGESEHRQASIAFLKFCGVDRLLRERGASTVAASLHRLISDVQAAADAEGVTFLGSDVNYDGGKLILVSGVPRSGEDDEGRLLRAVHSIVAAQDSAAQNSGPGLSLSIGVHRGPVFAGAVGPAYRRTFTVMGDAVNLAARVMSAASAGQVLATAGVLERSHTAFATTAVMPFRAKGKKEPVQAFEVGELRGTQQNRDAIRLPLTGRDIELSTLERALEAAHQGIGQVVEISGDLGVGKSRLLEELRDRSSGVPFRLVHCEQYETSTPFFAVRVLLRALLDGDDRIAERVEAAAPHLLPWLPLIAGVLDVEAEETESTRHLDPRFRRQRTNMVVSELLAVLASGPTVFAFEDTHWTDDASSELLAHLASRALERPLLLVLTRRDDPGGFTSSRPETVRLALRPLDDDAARRLVSAATEDAPIPPYKADAIIDRAAGNPLFLEELILTADVSDELPETLEAVVGAQIDRLPPAESRLLRVAAVLGMSFEPALLEAVADDVLEDRVALQVARLSGYVNVERDGRLRFRHRLLRDVAYSTLPFRRREQLHARAVAAIEALRARSRATDHAEVLSMHCFHAKQYAKCWEYALSAGEKAKSSYALVEAGELFERALAAARRSAGAVARDEMDYVWGLLGMTRQLAGRYAEADAAYREARLLRAGDEVRVANLCSRHAHIAELLGRPRSSARWIHRGLRSLDARSDDAANSARAHLLNMKAWLRYQLGDPHGAVKWATEAQTVAAQCDNLEALAEAYKTLDNSHIALGKLDRATNSARALAIYEQLDKLDNVAVILNDEGVKAYFEGRWTEALDFYDRSRQLLERIGNVVQAAMSSCNIAEIFADQGRLDDAERVLSEVVKLWRAMEFPLGVARASRYLARVELRRGDHELALVKFEEARATFAEHGMGANVLEVDVWMAECLLNRGDIDGATVLLDDALAREMSTGSTEMRSMTHRLRAYCAIAENRHEDAWAELDSSLAIARDRGASFDVALGLEALAVLAQIGGLPLSEEARREREELLAGLGVVAPPAPPLAKL